MADAEDEKSNEQAEGDVAPEEAAPEAAAGGSADLLNMFQESQIEAEDRSAIVDLAGDVELVDLLEELHTVASALGCTGMVPAA